MRVLGLPLALLLVVAAAARDAFDFKACAREDADLERCARRVDEVVEGERGVAYFARLACRECAYAETGEGGSDDDGEAESRLRHGDVELFLNITLTNNTRSLLLNNNPVFPALPTIPHPPHIAVPLLPAPFSYTNLSAAATCADPTCARPPTSRACEAWCRALPLAHMLADYAYAAHLQRDDAAAGLRVWDVVFDPVGGRSAGVGESGSSSALSWTLDDPERKALRIVVEEQRVTRGSTRTPADDGGLFGSAGADANDQYTLTISTVELVARRASPSTPAPTFFSSIRRFFGGDVWAADGELVYLGAEWGAWGKKGTLRNWAGSVVHSHFISVLFVVVACAVGAFVALRALRCAWRWAQRQSGLARWEGIDAVYSQLNQDRGASGGDAEWRARHEGFGDEAWSPRHEAWRRRDDAWQVQDDRLSEYRDSYDSGPSQTHTHPSTPWHDTQDRLHTADRMKPLPTKPLPEKPLPLEPLIDA